MMISYRPAAGLRKMTATRPGRRGAGSATVRRSIAMKWETPAAIDFRFGMEITMYIANR